MKFFSKILLCSFLIAGSLGMLWLTWHSMSKSYNFWKFGIEKRATVTTLDDVRKNVKGPLVFHYVLRIDNHKVVKGFLYQLPIDSSIPVLTLSGGSFEDDVMIGTKRDSFLNIFSAVIGSKFLAIIWIFVLLPCFAITTWKLPQLVKKIWHQSVLEYF